MIPRDWPISHVGSSRSFAASILIFVVLLLSWQLALAQFTQQGPKLVGNDAAGLALQGNSVVLSADGNTAIVGGFGDSSNMGAAWVYTRSNGVWTQQAASWSVPARLEMLAKANLSRCPPATPPS